MFLDRTMIGKVLSGVSQSLNVVYHSPAVMCVLVLLSIYMNNLINLTTYSGDKSRIINTTVSAGHKAQNVRTEVDHVNSVYLILSKANRSLDLELDLAPSRSYRYARQDGILVSQAKIKVVKFVRWPYRSPHSFESIWINLLVPWIYLFHKLLNPLAFSTLNYYLTLSTSLYILYIRLW